jgi:putative nucleotidyltransferase with HDIG domain
MALSPEVWAAGEGEALPSFTAPLSARGMKCFLNVPILFEGRPMAVMTLGHASNCVWSDEDKQNARQLGDQAGVALSNSQLMQKLHNVHWGALSALARAIDAKSPWTLGHSERVTDLAMRLAREMGISEAELEVMRRGGLLHDIGKIGVPAEILDKPGKLTEKELQQMREHVNIGVRILQPIPGFEEAMPIVAQHHEWVNGEGYPNRLKGDEITLHARIFAVADCYDALISDRPYRAGLPVAKVVEMIKQGAGRQFDPQVVKVLEGLVHTKAEGSLRPEVPAVESVHLLV